MLSEDRLRKIARDECVDMLGKDLVYAHKDLCCSCYGLMDSGMFEYNLGMDTKEREYHMGGESKMEFYAFVSVDPETGQVTRDYENSTLPNK